MKAMWTESVRPLLMERQNCTLHSVTLRVLGGESDIEYKVRDLLENPNPTAAIYCKTGECEIRITARARSDEDGEKMCRAYAKKFYDMLGDAVYDEDVAGLEETVVHTLQEKGLTIATAESCTGGLIAQRLTSVSGSSEVFGYGFVTYWEQAKAWPAPPAATRCALSAPFIWALPGMAWPTSRSFSSPGLTVRWCAPGPHRLHWNWRCVWHRAKSLPGRRPSPQSSSRTTKHWLHWMRRSSGKNQK